MLTRKQWVRLQAARKVLAGRWTMKRAAEAVKLSTRQMRRVCRAIEARGDSAVVHGNRRRAASNRKPEELRKRVLELFRKKYLGFNDHHFVEKLASLEGIEVGRETVRRWLRAAGLGAARKRRPPKHRRRRERKAQAGFMLLWDGSRHAWLEERGPMMCLVGAIDDASGDFLPGAHFVEQECSAAYLRVLKTITKEHGLPWCCYGDRHSIFKRNDDHWTLEEELRGEQDPTQLGHALKALGIERIDALSPQAKGRVERLWGTLQDRLVSELRLAGARTIEQANAVLERYRPEHNERFSVVPAEREPAWRSGHGIDLDRLLSFRYEATVLNDNSVKLGGLVLDIPPGPNGRSYAKARVEVRQLLDGSWRIYLGERLIATAPASPLGELRARRIRKRSAASRVFRQAVLNI